MYVYIIFYFIDPITWHTISDLTKNVLLFVNDTIDVTRFRGPLSDTFNINNMNGVIHVQCFVSPEFMKQLYILMNDFFRQYLNQSYIFWQQ